MSISYTLMHPTENVPATAERLETWHDWDGTPKGAKLQFSCGHTCHMTFSEVEAAKQAAVRWRSGSTLAQELFGGLR
jgi:hypothetical protein